MNPVHKFANRRHSSRGITYGPNSGAVRSWGFGGLLQIGGQNSVGQTTTTTTTTTTATTTTTTTTTTTAGKLIVVWW